MAKAKKKVAPKAATNPPDAQVQDTNTDTLVAINTLLLEIDSLKARQEIIIDGFQFVADQVRNTYGTSHLAPVFDAVVKRLRP